MSVQIFHVYMNNTSPRKFLKFTNVRYCTSRNEPNNFVLNHSIRLNIDWFFTFFGLHKFALILYTIELLDTFISAL